MSHRRLLLLNEQYCKSFNKIWPRWYLHYDDYN